MNYIKRESHFQRMLVLLYFHIVPTYIGFMIAVVVMVFAFYAIQSNNYLCAFFKLAGSKE